MSLANSLFERIAEFLGEHPPFQYINKADLTALAKVTRVKFHEADEIVFEAGQKRKKFFFVINTGAVRVTSEGSGRRTLSDLREQGDIMGTGHLMDPDGTYVNTAVTEEDTILYAIPWIPFADLLPDYPDVIRYLRANISLRSDIRIPSMAHSVEMFPGGTPNVSDGLIGRIEETTKLSEYAKERFVNCRPKETMQEVAFKLLNNKAEAIIVINPEDHPLGIVTKTDLARAVQSGRAPSEAFAEEFMSSPVITVQGNPRIGDCLRIMMKSGYQHICLTEDGTLESPAKGVISERDLMLYYGNNPMVIIRQIGEINSFEELSHMRHRADMLILNELRNANSIAWFSEVVNDLNRAFVKKVIRLALDALRAEGHYLPQSSFCLFFAGMGGRKELFTRSAMDRGIVWVADDPKDAEYCQSFYEKLSVQIHEGLLKCGWTKNQKEYTELNKKWCQPLSVWKQYFYDWIAGSEDELAENLHWFDMLPADGFEGLVEQIFVERKIRIKGNDDFLRKFAKVTLQANPESKVFENFHRKGDGDAAQPYDLNQNALVPMVNIARMLAFAYDIENVTATFDRYIRLAELDKENRTIYEDAAEGFRILLLVIARAGLRDQNTGDLIDTSEMSSLEIQLVKSTFHTILRLENLIEKKFLNSEKKVSDE